jgi:molybdopterin molybdotransferase
VVQWENGSCTVTPAQEQGSGILKSTVKANGLLIFPLESTEITKGEQVTVQMLE